MTKVAAYVRARRSDFSHETSCRDSSPPASAQTNHGWLQRGTKRPFQAVHQPQSLRAALFLPVFWVSADAKGRCACVRAHGMRCWDKRKEAKPLRQVHRKLLRNWQVNCATHAWAMAPGERRICPLEPSGRHLHRLSQRLLCNRRWRRRCQPQKKEQKPF